MNLIGQKFGKLTVINRDNSKKRVYWNCKCDCGKMISVRQDSLLSGVTKSCGCLRHPNLIGKRFGKLVVIEQINPGKKNSQWKCLCDCGKYCIKNYQNLIKSPYPSCGCETSNIISQNHLIDLTNKKFGKLTVLKRIKIQDEKEPHWLCKCDCGNEKIVRGQDLRYGNTKSCGCLVSNLEFLLKKYLEKRKISYKEQFQFSDLYYKNKNYPLRFDFAIFENNNLKFLIECQGKQHYDSKSKFYSEEGLERDKLKEEYCKNNNLKLIKILDINFNENILDEIFEEEN